MPKGIFIEEKAFLSFKTCINPVNTRIPFAFFISKTSDIYKYSFKKQFFEKIFTAEMSPLESDPRSNHIDQLCLPLAKKAFALIDIDKPKRYSEPVFDMKKIWIYVVSKNEFRLVTTFNVSGQEWDGGYAGDIGTRCHVSKDNAFILDNPFTSWGYANNYMRQLVKNANDVVNFIGLHQAIVRAGREFSLIDLSNGEHQVVKTLDIDITFPTVVNDKFLLIVLSSKDVQIIDPTNQWKCLAQKKNIRRF